MSKSSLHTDAQQSLTCFYFSFVLAPVIGNVIYTSPGTSVYVVGNISLLGNWSVTSVSQKLEPTSYPTWTGMLKLLANKDLQWKCVKALDNSLTITEWQPDANTSSRNNEISIGTSNASTSGSF